MCKKHLTSDGALVISLYLPVKKHAYLGQAYANK